MSTIEIRGGVLCPVCGVVSNPYPDYIEGETTAVAQRLSYCGHLSEFPGEIAELLWKVGELECWKLNM